LGRFKFFFVFQNFDFPFSAQLFFSRVIGMKPTPQPVARSFKAVLERMLSNLGWVIVRIPLDVPKVWGTRGMLKVKGVINGFAFRTSLFPTGRGFHYLLVNKRMQAGANAAPGNTAHFRIEPDTEKRVATVPAELERILDEYRSLRHWFDQLNYSTRKWICDRVTEVKSAEVRVRRAEQVAEQLLSTMEAERELPPILKLAFARDPRTFAGWQRMSPSHRRGQLLAIFYYRTPAARDRRIAKVLEDTLAHADRKPKRQT
jgi:uncharacterized protein YdeI (YjbR/CyaY-like superfamily)